MVKGRKKKEEKKKKITCLHPTKQSNIAIAEAVGGFIPDFISDLFYGWQSQINQSFV